MAGMAPRNIVVLGAGLAGTAAAARARETDDDARITVLDALDMPAPLPALAYALSGEAVSVDAVTRRRTEGLKNVQNVTLRAGRIRRIDPSARSVVLEDGVLDYSALVFALPAVPGRVASLEPAPNVLHLRTVDELTAIQAELRQPGRRVAVLGAGPSAIEAADNLRRGGHHPEILTRQPRLLPDFTVEGSRRVTDALQAAGIPVRTEADVKSALRDGARVREIELEDGTRVAADLVIVAAPLEPGTALLREAGAELHEDGSVVVDECCATSLTHVYACGLSVAVPHVVSGWPVWSPHPSLADRTAQVAGTCAAGGAARLRPVVNSVIVRAGDVVVARTGLTRPEAIAFAGEEAGIVAVHGSTNDRFLSTSRPLTVELVFHRGDGHILGAEVAGGMAVDKRVDVLAAAIAGGLTVEGLASLELAYAPPFGTVRDVVNTAGAVAAAWREGAVTPWEATALYARRGEVTLVDVDPERGRAGALVGALVVPLGELRARLSSLPRGKPLVFISQTGRLGYLASRIARLKGRRDAGFLSGGLLSWRAAGLQVEDAGTSR